MELTLVPAYGRDYTTVEALKRDWESGKDFRIATVASPDCGRYTSIRDLKKLPGNHVKLRYNQLQDCVLVSIKDGSFGESDEA